MKKILICLMTFFVVIGCQHRGDSRIVQDFNFDWRFSLGDEAIWADSSFDDVLWRKLHLPHDWAIEGEFSAKNPSGPNGGALPGGIGWYRKHFITPSSEKVFIEFDGVYMNSTVYVNGHKIGNRPYGYSSFCYDLTPYLNPKGEDNLIAVRCDNSGQPSGRWYTGCGIYRNVRLVMTNEVHYAYNGLFVTTPNISADKADVLIDVEVDSPTGTEYKIINTVYDRKGKEIARGGRKIEVKKPILWDVDSPYLYTLKSEIISGGKVVDNYQTQFGFRTLDWNKDKGFALNGRYLKIHGVCLHHDLGCIGTAVHYRAIERQMEILKEMGVNAVRTSHNMPAPELLAICDSLGILVMNEAFDSWRRPKARFEYAGAFEEWHERDLADFVKRDRNHPSVFMWSIGNEIPEQSAKTPEDAVANENLTRHLAEIVKRYDTTRVVTAGTNGVDRDNCLLTSRALDVIGLNYHDYGYDSLRTWFPETPIIASETASALNSRGIYYQPSTELRTLPRWTFYSRGPKPENISNDEPVFHQCTAYDICHAFWNTTLTHQDAWLVVKNLDWVAGVFVWTGFDYLGEPTAFGWPSRSSYFGICDLAGFPKDPYYMYQSEWTNNTVLHLHPHWNWNTGEKIDIWAYYNNADEVELFVNGRSLGRSSKTADCLHAFWPEVPFEKGKIEAVSYKNGKEIARTVRETTGSPKAIKMEADRDVLRADGYDLSYITISTVDAEGREVPNADTMLDFSVYGAGELFGIDNGNAADTLCLKGNRKQLFSGKALAVVRSLRDEPGEITLTVKSSIGNKSITIKTK